MVVGSQGPVLHVPPLPELWWVIIGDRAFLVLAVIWNILLGQVYLAPSFLASR